MCKSVQVSDDTIEVLVLLINSSSQRGLLTPSPIEQTRLEGGNNYCSDLSMFSFLLPTPEHVCSILASLLRNLRGQQRTRLLNKFTENDSEKVGDCDCEDGTMASMGERAPYLVGSEGG